MKRVTWVCGDQPILVDEILETTRRNLSVSEMNYASFSVGSTPEREIWASANQYPMAPSDNRLVVVRESERIVNWSPLEDWLSSARNIPTVYLLFISGEADFPHIFEGGKKVGMQPHAALIRSKGVLVRCALPSEDDLVDWVCRQSSLDQRMASYLLTRVGGDLRQASNVCKKLAPFASSVVPGAGILNQLCSEAPVDSFSDSLILGRKLDALAALPSVSPEDFSRTVGLLDSRLDFLQILNQAVRNRMTMREIAVLPGVSLFLARKFLAVAKVYDVPTVEHRRKVLAVVDDALLGGARVGLFESLVALW